MQIDTDIPAGNLRILSQEDHRVRIAPDLRDTEGHWFYWHFRVRDAAGETWCFDFGKDPCIGPRGPAVSLDQGATWSWLGADAVHGESFMFTFPTDTPDLRFAMCVPYTAADWHNFRRQDPGRGRDGVLTLTRKGRPLPFWRNAEHPAPTTRLLLTARHHACESMANFVLEGFLSGWPEKPSWELMAVPLMDLDGVEDGDQGKQRRPRDHNRDYGPDSRYPEVQALKSWIAEHPVPRLLALDLHCPWLRGNHNDCIYQVGSSAPRIAEAQSRLALRLEEEAQGLPYTAADDLPHGQGWNTPNNYEQGLSCAAYFARVPGCAFAGTFEIPYASARDVEVTPERCRDFGASLSRAVAGSF